MKDDPTDDRILECAVASRSTVLISGDKHLLGLGSYHGVLVMRVGDILRKS